MSLSESSLEINQHSSPNSTTRPSLTSMDAVPEISVLMPVYNADRYVMYAVQSVLHQSYPSFELIIVDDGSTDQSLAILRHFEASDSRIRLISRGNTGYVTALNEMLAIARGRFLARMDADDFAMPNRFAMQHSFLAKNERVAAIGSDVEFIDARGRFLRVEKTAHDNDDIQTRLLRGECPLCHPAVMMRTDRVREVGGYRPEYQPAEDRDLWLRLGEIAELANLPVSLLKYRLHGGSVSETQRGDQMSRLRAICEEAWQRRGIEGQFTAKTEIRPSRKRRSKFEFELKYGWWAFESGEKRTSISYAWSAIGLMPWRREGWQLLRANVVRRPREANARSEQSIQMTGLSVADTTSPLVNRRPR